MTEFDFIENLKYLDNIWLNCHVYGAFIQNDVHKSYYVISDHMLFLHDGKKHFWVINEAICSGTFPPVMVTETILGWQILPQRIWCHMTDVDV